MTAHPRAGHADRRAAPLTLYLPNGVVVERNADGGFDGVDVTIPDDLKGTWFWFGSFLSDGQVGIFTGTFGISGAFAQARIHMGLRQTLTIECGKPQQLSMFGEAA